jgi:hypothetical protein
MEVGGPFFRELIKLFAKLIFCQIAGLDERGQ